MRRCLRALYTASVMVLIAVPAMAQENRLYFAGYLGLNLAASQDFSEKTSGRSGSVKRKTGPSFAGALGLRLSEQWRIEAELSYRKSDVKTVNINGAGSFKAGGDLGTTLYMLNLYYDFDYEWKNITPFVTAGVGLAAHNGSLRDASGLLPSVSDESYGFAYSVGGGLRYRLDDHAALTTNYRYIGTADFDAKGYDLDYNNHEFRLGVQYDIPVDFFK